MLTPTLLVTIRGPHKTMDLELPGNVPVDELIPLLLEICDPQTNDPQTLRQVSLSLAGTSVPLSSRTTLIEANIYDGAVLVLQTKHTPPPVAERPMPQNFVPKSVQPATNTGGIGVTWQTLG
jgi:hypothetical protein